MSRRTSFWDRWRSSIEAQARSTSSVRWVRGRASPKRVLNAYVHRCCVGQYKPQVRWLQNFMRGVLGARSLHLADAARYLRLHDSLESGEVYLSRGLNADRLEASWLEEAYLRDFLKPILAESDEDVVIAIDETDLQRPYAKRGQPFIHSVRDGSNGEPGQGYEYLAAEVRFGAHSLPVAGHLFSAAHPGYKSKVDELRRLLRRIDEYVPDDAVLALDRGFDGRHTFDALFEFGRRFVLRLSARRKRNLFVDRFGDASIPIARLVDDLKTKFVTTTAEVSTDTHQRLTPGTKLELAWETKVLLSAYAPSGVRTERVRMDRRVSIVAARLEGFDEPLVIMTNVHVQDIGEAERIVRWYIQRWVIEDGFRFAKVELGLEKKLRSLTWRGINRLVLIAQLARAFLSLLVMLFPELAKQVAQRHWAFHDPSTYPQYRIIRGLEYELSSGI